MKKLNLTITKPANKNAKQIINVVSEVDEPFTNTINISPKKKRFKISKKFIIIFVTFLIFGGLAVFAYWRFNSYTIRVQNFDQEGNQTNTCTNILNPDCWTDAFKPQLKQTNGFTNALLLGLDTRPNGSLMNTDSIIIASYNHTTRKTMLISIPRDFFSTKYQVKISAVYAYTHNKDKSDSFRYIKEELTNITGLQINYVVKVYLDGVTNLVNAIGGIQVCPSADFTAKYPNPNPTSANDQWIYRDYKKGCQAVDGFGALIYARFRHIRKGPGELASDFSRIKRQQEVITAVKDKLLSQDLSIQERVENYWSLIQGLDQTVQFDFTFEDFLAGISLLDGMDKDPAKIFLDPNFGGGFYKLIYEKTNDANGYTERPKDTTYKALRDEINQIIANIDFYKEKPSIVVRNQTGIKTLPSDNVALSIKENNKYWVRFDVLNESLNDKYIGIKLFDFTGGTKPGSLAIIKNTLGINNVELLPETYGVSRSDKNEDFLILIGPTNIPTGTTTPTL